MEYDQEKECFYKIYYDLWLFEIHFTNLIMVVIASEINYRNLTKELAFFSNLCKSME